MWAIGTEINLVNRLAQENPDKTVFCLDPVICPCATIVSNSSGLSTVGARRSDGRTRDKPRASTER